MPGASLCDGRWSSCSSTPASADRHRPRISPYRSDSCPGMPWLFSYSNALLIRARLKHRFQDAVGRLVAVGEGLDVDDDLLAHIDAAFDGGRAHMREQHDVVELQQLRIDRGLVLEDVEAGAGQLLLL